MEFSYPEIYSEMLKSPHILIAGSTGCGKSVTLNGLIYSAMIEGLERKDGTRFIYFDMKMVELIDWRDIPTCVGYVDRPENAPRELNRMVDLMYKRYEVMQSRRQKETQEGHIYIVIDELADFIQNKGCLDPLVTIGRLGRAAHIHIIACTQDPSRGTLSAPFMQNMSGRLALKCNSPIESRQIVGTAGAEELPAHGTGILNMGRTEYVEVPMVEQEDIERLIEGLGGESYRPVQKVATRTVNFNNMNLVSNWR